MLDENKSNPMSVDGEVNLAIKDGWLTGVQHIKSPHYTVHEPADCAETFDAQAQVSLLIVHNISLPPAQFGGPYISDLFMGCLDPDAHPYFKEIAHLRVSAHCLIRRDGYVIQYVSFNDKAWHAGVSAFNGREKCNDYSIGIELEGTDDIAYTPEQYRSLCSVVKKIQGQYPLISHTNIVGHCDVAPGRKTDPGESFDWAYFHQQLKQ